MVPPWPEPSVPSSSVVTTSMRLPQVSPLILGWIARPMLREERERERERIVSRQKLTREPALQDSLAKGGELRRAQEGLVGLGYGSSLATSKVRVRTSEIGVAKGNLAQVE